MLQTTCTGVAWELCTAHTMGFVARCVMGEWAESAQAPARVGSGGGNEKRSGTRSTACACSDVRTCSTWRQTIRTRHAGSSVRTSPRGHTEYYDIQRANALLGRVDIALYEGRPAHAVDVIRTEWELIVRSKLLRLSTTFTFSWAARARATLSLACLPDIEPRLRQALLHEASLCARQLRKAAPPWGYGIGTLILAGIASCQGDRGRATQLLVEAEDSLRFAGLTPYVMAARWRLATSRGSQEAIAMEASVDDWASKQNIRRPERILGPAGYQAAGTHDTMAPDSLGSPSCLRRSPWRRRRAPGHNRPARVWSSARAGATPNARLSGSCRKGPASWTTNGSCRSRRHRVQRCSKTASHGSVSSRRASRI